MSYLTVQSRLVTGALLLLTLPAVWNGEASGQSESTAPTDLEALTEWARGPVRWLLLPAEQSAMREVSSRADAFMFVERFWARRDPDPATRENPFRETFYKRVEAADLLYAEDDVRGSLTDRGRALILLGSPTGLRVTSQEALSWDPSSGSEDNVRIRYLPLEIWTYQLEHFQRPLRLALMALGDETQFRVSFVKDIDRTSLQEGESLLDLAAKTALALGTEN